MAFGLRRLTGDQFVRDLIQRHAQDVGEIRRGAKTNLIRLPSPGVWTATHPELDCRPWPEPYILGNGDEHKMTPDRISRLIAAAWRFV
jgi:hypothetical protein